MSSPFFPPLAPNLTHTLRPENPMKKTPSFCALILTKRPAWGGILTRTLGPSKAPEGLYSATREAPERLLPPSSNLSPQDPRRICRGDWRRLKPSSGPSLGFTRLSCFWFCSIFSRLVCKASSVLLLSTPPFPCHPFPLVIRFLLSCRARSRSCGRQAISQLVIIATPP